MNKNRIVFLGEALADLINSKVTIKLESKLRVDGGKYNGYFTDEPIEEFGLAINKKEDLWFTIFLHEYCHFLQWKEGAKVWKDMDIIPDDENWDKWLAGKKKYSKARIDLFFDVTKRVEFDCEKRAVELIKKYGLDIELKRYIQKANAYIFFYNLYKEKKQWYVRPPYEFKSILKTMPTNFLAFEKYNKTPDNFRRLVERLCFKE